MCQKGTNSKVKNTAGPKNVVLKWKCNAFLDMSNKKQSWSMTIWWDECQSILSYDTEDIWNFMKFMNIILQCHILFGLRRLILCHRAKIIHNLLSRPVLAAWTKIRSGQRYNSSKFVHEVKARTTCYLVLRSSFWWNTNLYTTWDNGSGNWTALSPAERSVTLYRELRSAFEWILNPKLTSK